MPRKCISSDQSRPTKRQHKSPCSDCPFARTALHGWLGELSVDEWLQVAHSDSISDCHVYNNQQCAGLAVYRANVLRRPRPDADPMPLQLAADKKKVFSTPMEFHDHHSRVRLREKKKHG